MGMAGRFFVTDFVTRYTPVSLPNVNRPAPSMTHELPNSPTIASDTSAASSALPLGRTALFERVWAEPTQHLAARYGISVVNLKKLCRREQIPTLGRGYWARVQAGTTFSTTASVTFASAPS